jgi:plastocyanin
MRKVLISIFSLLAVSALALGIAACGGDDDDDEEEADEATEEEAEEATEEAEETEEAEDGAATGGANVAIVDFTFDPANLEVAVGDTVTWTNADPTAHTATADDGSFDSGNIDTDGTFEFTFEEAGEFTYICEIHTQMTGTITVSESGQAPASDGNDVDVSLSGY